ncbi:LysR family transcriptional regulator [Pelagimonas sp. KU-00592-HH]|uniref:LysR family transcriptional regulator n=1 Tax=Pelagimonas sp. KU-00592-HH TaxID=3127651 RepID=UPI0031071223
MKLSQVDMNLFLVFDVIYAERNLTRAAEVLSVTQPTVSNALARMRAQFNDPLFVKTSRGMTPTPFAESLSGRIGEAMGLLASSAHARDEFRPDTSQRVFRLSMNDWLEVRIMPDLAAAISLSAPNVGLRSHRVSRSDILRDLASGALDLAIDVPLENAADLVHVPLVSQRYVCAVRRGHPLAGQALTIEEYLALGHVHVSGRRRGGGLVDFALQRIGKRRALKLRLQHYHSAAPVIRTSDLALTITEDLARDLDFEVLELPFDVPELAFNLYWHRLLDEDPANLWIRNQVIGLFSDVNVDYEA